MEKRERQFLLEKLKELESKSKKFQSDCDKKIENQNNVLLCLPTGSGKTDRFLIWAIKKILEMDYNAKIIITAPIKALSNQRFSELFVQGYNVGIETGDIKYNTEKCTFLCCTQEIATYKYVKENCISVIDEFHYIYSDPARTRTYVEYIINSQSPYMFLCSATMGNIMKIKDYISKTLERNFFVYSDDKRLTNLYYNEDIRLQDIRDAFVVSFSREQCIRNAIILIKKRKQMLHGKLFMSKDKINAVLKTATKYEIENDDLIINAISGIAYYYGSMLPKERLFISELFSQKIIDTVFGTDALALGVNFPIKNVVLTTLRKGGVVISKNLFEQLVGRAGRYGLYNEGYVYYCDKFSEDVHLKEDYRELRKKINEDVLVKVIPDIKYVLTQERTIEEEIEYAKKYSTVLLDEKKLRKQMESSINLIRNFDIEQSLAQFYFYGIFSPRKYREIKFDEIEKTKLLKFRNLYGDFNRLYMQEFFENIAKVYNSEFSALDNCLLLRDIICGFDLNTILFDGLKTKNYKTRFRVLLQIRKYLNALPEKYISRIDLVKLDKIISNIDRTVFDIELAFRDNELFDTYSFPGLSDILKRGEASDNLAVDLKKSSKKREPKKTMQKKQETIVKIEKAFAEGSLIKKAGASFGSPRYLVLLYTETACLLLNYNAYTVGSIILNTENDLLSYFKLCEINKEEYKDILVKCKGNSEKFFTHSKSKNDIKKLLK